MADLPVRLADLPGAARAREWSEHCRRSHQHFATKVCRARACARLALLWLLVMGLRRAVHRACLAFPLPQVSELEALWEGLRRDVEGLFMQVRACRGAVGQPHEFGVGCKLTVWLLAELSSPLQAHGTR